jgi:hypothetical protein
MEGLSFFWSGDLFDATGAGNRASGSRSQKTEGMFRILQESSQTRPIIVVVVLGVAVVLGRAL